MAHTWLSPLDPCPHDAVGERTALKPSLLFLILYPAYKLARYRCCFVQVNPNLCPKHSSATSINASVNGDLNRSTSTSSSSRIVVVAILNRTPQRHAGLWQRWGMIRALPFSVFFFFCRWKKVWQHRPRLFTVLYFSVRLSRSSTLRVMGCHLAWVSKLLRGLEL